MSRELLIEQLLPDYRAWLRKVASGLLSPSHEALDDLVQEGYWRRPYRGSCRRLALVFAA